MSRKPLAVIMGNVRRTTGLGSLGLSLLYASLGLLYATELRFFPNLPFFALFVVIPASFYLAYFQRQTFFFFGLAICILPFFSYHILEIFFLSYLALRHFLSFKLRGDIESKEVLPSGLPLAIWLLVLALLSAAATALRWQSDSWNIASISADAGVWTVFEYLWSNPRSWNSTPLFFAAELLALLLFLDIFKSQPSQKNALDFARGLAVGSIAALVILVLQFFGPAVFSFNRGAFWHLSGRYPASFTDPNAAGLFAALIVPFLVFLRVEIPKVALSFVSLLLIAALSGSRTFLFSLAIFLVYLTYRKKYFARVLLLFVTTILLLGYPPLNESLVTNFKALNQIPTAQRILQTLNWEHTSAMFSNRFVYARLAVEVWKENWLTGVGLDGFYPRQEAAANSLGLKLGGWKDNANNYYLQLLAERGVFGFVLSLLAWVIILRALWLTRQRSNFNFAVFYLLGSFLILSLTGPHISFGEIRFLIFILLSLSALELKTVSIGSSSSLACLGVLLAFFVSTPRVWSRGLYGAEQSAESIEYWTSKQSRVVICPRTPEDLRFYLRTLNPQLAREPVSVAVSLSDISGLSLIEHYTLKDTNWIEVDFSRKGFHAKSMIVNILVSHTWIPGADRRSLGVQLRLPKRQNIEASCKLEDWNAY